MKGSHLSKGNSTAASSADGMAVPIGADSSALLDELYRDHRHPLARYIATRFGAGPPEPEEVAQAAFAKLAASSVAEIADPRGYLYTIACNIVIDHQRRSGHRDAIHRDLSAFGGPEELSETSPERVLLAKERFAIFEEALRAMPTMRRRIFLLVRVEGNSPREVALQFGMKEAAVHQHVSRALRDCVTAFAKAEQQE